MSPEQPDSPSTPATPAGASPVPQAPLATATSWWVYGLPALCLALTLGLWYETRQDIASLAAGQRQLAADLDAARGATTIDVAGAPALGPADQVVTLIEFSDYECPFCIRHFTQTMPQIEQQLIQTGKIRYVFRDFPIDSLHPAAARAHEAARCADEQGKFWQMHTRLFTPAGTHTDPLLTARAGEAGVLLPAFTACLESGKSKAVVQQAVQAAVQLGATGTPSFFVGIRDVATDQVRVLSAITGAQPYAEFEKAITAVAARVR